MIIFDIFFTIVQTKSPIILVNKFLRFYDKIKNKLFKDNLLTIQNLGIISVFPIHKIEIVGIRVRIITEIIGLFLNLALPNILILLNILILIFNWKNLRGQRFFKRHRILFPNMLSLKAPIKKPFRKISSFNEF